MLKQILFSDLTLSNVMFGIIILLGVIVFFKFSKYLLKIYFSNKSIDEPVLKNFIKKSDNIEPLNQ